jgi:hypothetical protein
MAVTPIEARCRRCRQDFHLFELLDYRGGTCPRCGSMLTPDWTAQLLEEAARADIAQRHLVGALRNLRNVPGHVVLRPHVVMRNLFEEIGWEYGMAEDPDMLREELRELRRLLQAWELLDPTIAGAQPHHGWFRRATDWLTGRPSEAAVPLRVAPDRLDDGSHPTSTDPSDSPRRQADGALVTSQRLQRKAALNAERHRN